MSKLFLITASYDEGVMKYWHFFANSELDVMEYVIDNFWDYEYFFRGLGCNIERDRVTPRILLDKVESSNIDGDSEMGYEIYEINISDIPVANQKRNSLLFSEISDKEIDEIIKIEKNWKKEFSLSDFEYKISEEETIFLEKILNTRYGDLYEPSGVSEYKIKIIYPLFEKVNFKIDDTIIITYDETVVENFNDINLGGKIDILIAKKQEHPLKKLPLFLINYYTNSQTHSDIQTVLRMLVVMKNKNISTLVALSISNNSWEFIKLEKSDDKYIFITSNRYFTDRIEYLKSIYKNLQSIKSLYCE